MCRSWPTSACRDERTAIICGNGRLRAARRPGTPRADIYSLGKVLYETCTGKDRLDFPEIDSQLSTRPDRERLLQLNDVLIKACANDPKKRYKSARKCIRASRTWRGEGPAKSRAKILTLAALLLCLG